MSLTVYFNAAPLLSPRTGIGQYCLNLMSEIEKMRVIDAYYFYAGAWSDALLREAPTGVSRTQLLKRTIGRTIPNLAYEIQQRWRGKHFRAGIGTAAPALYHEPNFLAFKTSLPIVATVHDLSILRYPETHPKDRVAFMSKRIGKTIMRADRIITDSEYVRQEVLAEFNLAPEKVVSVLLAAGERFSPVGSELLPATLAPFDLLPGKYILAVGTLEPRKNLTTAIQAYVRLPEVVREEIPFVVAGMQGWKTEGLDREVAALIEKGQIRRLGFVSDHALPALYSGARFFVYPSLYEGFGLPPLEAMACGAPVIVSNRSSLPEVVGDAGLKVDALDVDGLAEKMNSLVEDDALCVELGQRGIERARSFSWRRCAEQTLDVYREVVAQ
ncbi:MAG: wbpY [Proteobacteria bacterium]|nr:wbpY [Pseudomonadota bacterium]